MIDLRKRYLPDKLTVNGKDYKILTDFRIWIEFNRLAANGEYPTGIFIEKMPENAEWIEQALEFLQSPNATPNSSGSESQVLAFDFIRDGAYIVAAFMQAYGINLTEVDYMHWHLFKALFEGLPEDTKMSHIINYRLWKPSKRKHDDIMRENKRIWTLPKPEDEEAMKQAQEIAAKLYEEQHGGR